MTEQEERELGLRAATIFKDLFPEHWAHKTTCYKREPEKLFNCCKCNQNGNMDFAITPCTIPDPLNINWDNAMMLYRSLDACQRTNAHSELVQIFLQEIDDDRGTVDKFVAANNPTELMLSTDTWFWNFGEPKHLIKAAIKAREGERE